MKRSYKLLGHIWDQRPLSSEEIKMRKTPGFIQDFFQSWNLLDTAGYHRRIPLSSCLHMQNENDLRRLLNDVKDCDEIYLEDDMSDSTDNPTVIALLARRKMQIYTFLKDNLHTPDVYIAACSPASQF